MFQFQWCAHHTHIYNLAGINYVFKEKKIDEVKKLNKQTSSHQHTFSPQYILWFNILMVFRKWNENQKTMSPSK